MIADFAAENMQFLIKWVGLRSKTAVLYQVFDKVVFSGAGRLKTAVFSVVFKSRRSQDQKPWFLAKNCSFQCGFQIVGGA